MLRIFLYEFVTGGGFLGDGWGWPPDSLRREGAAMAAALAADLVAVGAQVDMLQDDRLVRFCPRGTERTAGPGPAEGGIEAAAVRRVRSAEEERTAFRELAAACDGTIVIAPELGHALLERCRWVDAAGGRLLGPSLESVALASDKHATAERLRRSGVPVPCGCLVEPRGILPGTFEFPAVGKPCLGAGSQGVQLLGNRSAAERWAAGLRETSRLERFHPGMAASVAVLCGSAGLFPLLPCRQRLGGPGGFCYLGGSLPLENGLGRRAAELAVRSVATLPGPMGYLGVDLVLGADPSGRDDVVIEINPRLTTSYVGLRAAADANLAAALLDACNGRVPRLSFRPVEVQFDSDGNCRLGAPDVTEVAGFRTGSG